MSAEEQSELVALPLGRVRKVMMNEDAAHVRAVTQEASLLVAKAAELFVKALTARALECKTGDGKLAFSDLGALCSVSHLASQQLTAAALAQLLLSQRRPALTSLRTQCLANGRRAKSWRAFRARGCDATRRTPAARVGALHTPRARVLQNFYPSTSVASLHMSFWCTIPSFSFRGPDVCVFSVEVGVQALDGAKTRRTVLRRFSDFVALAERLRKELGKDLPPLPPKQRLAARDEAFLNERRRALEAWVWALMQDVEAAHSQSLVSFLELQSARRGLRRERAAPEAAAASTAGQTESAATPPARSADARTTAAPPSNLALRDDERAIVRRTISGAPRRAALATEQRPGRPCLLRRSGNRV